MLPLVFMPSICCVGPKFAERFPVVHPRVLYRSQETDGQDAGFQSINDRNPRLIRGRGLSDASLELIPSPSKPVCKRSLHRRRNVSEPFPPHRKPADTSPVP